MEERKEKKLMTKYAIINGKIKFELFVTAVQLPHYKFRILLFGYGIGGYPVKVVLEERIANSIYLNSYIVDGKQFTSFRNRCKEKCVCCKKKDFCRSGCRIGLDIDLCNG